MPTRKPKIAVAVSGQGRSLTNLLASTLEGSIAGVIGSKADVPALSIAEQHGLPSYIWQGDLSSIRNWLREQNIDWIVLAGFLKLFPELPEYAGRVINIHPALLPRYGGKGMYGMRVHEAVFAAQELESGATVHFASEHYDEGALIAQISLSIEGCRSAKDVAQAVFDAECELLPKTLNGLLTGSLPLPNGKIWTIKKEL